MIYIGIDWADDHHDIVIADDSAKMLDQFRIDHTCDGFAPSVLLNSISQALQILFRGELPDCTSP